MINFGTNFHKMSNTENNSNFDWVWYVIGMITFVLAFMAVTFKFIYLLIGAILGFIFGAFFLHKIVKGRIY